MRRSVLTLMALALLAAVPAAATAKGPLAGVKWEQRIKAANEVAKSRGGKVSFSIRGGGGSRAGRPSATSP